MTKKDETIEQLSDSDIQELVQEQAETSKRSRAQLGVKKPAIRVAVNGIVYANLTKALLANGFNVKGDWSKVRNMLKAEGIGALESEDGTRVVFETTDAEVTSVESPEDIELTEEAVEVSE